MKKIDTTAHKRNSALRNKLLLPVCKLAHLPFVNLRICKLANLPFANLLLAFCLFSFIPAASAQNCNQITFNIVNYEPCKYRLTYVNSTDCYTDILITLSQGDFASYSANMPAGFSVEVFGQSQLRITHANGFLPLGSQAPMIFTLPFGLVTNAAIAYNDQCGMVGCEIIPGQLLESCPDPMDASIIGLKYRECSSLPYTNQATIPGWNIQLFDELGNLYAEQATGADGRFAFYDLPKGNYLVKEVAVPGWTPKVPVSGEYTVNLAASQQVARNFGNCPGCSCDSIQVVLYQQPGSTDTSTYSLVVQNSGDYCFPYYEITVDSGSLVGWANLLSGWDAQLVSAQTLRLLPPGGYLPDGLQQLATLMVSGQGMHKLRSSTIIPGGSSCTSSFSFQNPPSTQSASCCPAGSVLGPELVVNGDFSLGAQNAFSTDYNYGIGSPNTAAIFYPGQLQYPFFNFGKTGYSDRYLGVDASLMANKAAWKQQVNVTPNADYVFCAAVNNSWWPLPPNQQGVAIPMIRLWIEDNVGATVASSTPFALNNSPDVWVNLSLDWTTPTVLNGPYTLKIGSTNLSQNGNDFSIDCISFRECRPPAPCDATIAVNFIDNCGHFQVSTLATGPASYSYQWCSGETTQFLDQVRPCGSYNYCVTVTCMDGTQSAAALTVVVADNINPTIMCPPNQSVQSFSPDCAIAVYSIQNYGATDNCGTPSVAYSIAGVTTGSGSPDASGTVFSPGSSTVTYTATDWCGNTATCTFEVNVDCHTCTCLGFSNLSFYNFLNQPDIPTDCDMPAVGLPCIAQDALYWFQWQLNCSDPLCNQTVSYSIVAAAGGPPLLTGTIPPGSPHFLNFGYLQLAGPGNYQIILTGVCGTDTCVCAINFSLPPCGCCSPNFNGFMQTVSSQISLSQQPGACKATLNIGNLPCQRVNWINWGDQTIVQGPFLSGAMPMHTYTQSGTYTVTYSVTEINQITGAPCFQKTVSETITVTCPACNCVMSNLSFDRDGSPHPVLCDNPAQTPTFGCPVSDVTLTGLFGCVQPDGTPCSNSEIKWNLYGPNGFVSKGTLPGPTLGINFPAAAIGAPGTYTVSLQMLCPGQTDSCYCQLSWVQSSCDPCCQGDMAAFLAAAMNVQTFGTLGTCTLSYQAVGLTGCMQITYDWGDNTSSGPFGDNVPVTHTYAQSGIYNVCYTIEEVNANGFACHNFQSCEPVDVICSDCVCGTFSNLFARPSTGAPSIALSCGGTYNFGCPKTGFGIPITGKFECMGAGCSPASAVSWQLIKPSGGTVSGNVAASPYFYLSISPLDYAMSGQYTLILTGNCGGQPCPPCVIKFTVNCPDPCPCDPNQLDADVAKGFATSWWITSCKTCFSPVALNDCDMVFWSVNGGPVVAMTTGAQSFCYVFPGPGMHLVTMMVTRKKSDGTVCHTAIYQKLVNVTCGLRAACDNSVFPNSGFSEGAVAGPMNDTGAVTGWSSLSGHPLVTEGVPGSLDQWAIGLSGNLDSTDLLVSLEPVCIKNDIGTISMRLRHWGDPHENLNGKHIKDWHGKQKSFDLGNCDGFDCFETANIDISFLDSNWVDMEIPFDLSDWVVDDTCGGINAYMAVFVTSPLGSEQGSQAETRTRIQLDNLCVDGAMVGVHDLPYRNLLRLLPNPNTGIFNAVLPEAASPGMLFRITDPAGRLLLTQGMEPGSQQQALRVAALPSGLYFLQVVRDGKVLAVERIVRQ